MSIPDALKAAARVLFLVVGIAVVATFVVIGVPQLVGAEYSFVVMSGSMEPAMSPGDVVLVDDRPLDEIEVGDTITYATGPRPTTHEVIEASQDGDIFLFKTKGIANEDPDPGVVRGESVIGVTMLVIPYAGHIVLLANTKMGAALFLIVPGALLVLNEVYGLARDYRAGATADREVTQDGD